MSPGDPSHVSSSSPSCSSLVPPLPSPQQLSSIRERRWAEAREEHCGAEVGCACRVCACCDSCTGSLGLADPIAVQRACERRSEATPTHLVGHCAPALALCSLLPFYLPPLLHPLPCNCSPTSAVWTDAELRLARTAWPSGRHTACTPPSRLGGARAAQRQTTAPRTRSTSSAAAAALPPPPRRRRRRTRRRRSRRRRSGSRTAGCSAGRRRPSRGRCRSCAKGSGQG